jgi:hypothetical protein
MLIQKNRDCALAAIFLIAALPVVRAEDGAGVTYTRDAIVKAWEARTAKYRSVDATFDERVLKQPPNIRRSKTSPPPSSKVTWRVQIADGKCRLEVVGAATNKGSPSSEAFIATFDGMTSKKLYPVTQNHQGEIYPSGFIFKERKAQTDKQLMVWPFRWSFGTINLGPVDFSPAHVSIVPVSGMFDGDPCVLAKISQEGRETDVLWFDPKKDFSIVRYVQERRSGGGAQLDCSFSHDASGLWLPVKWTATWFDPENKPWMVYEMATQHAVVNMAIPPEEFDLQFPVGTVVSDMREGQPKGRSGTFDYVVEDNSKKRRITWDELWSSYADLRRTRSGEAVPSKLAQKRASSVTSWLIWINVAFLALLISFLIGRRRRRGRGNTGGANNR